MKGLFKSDKYSKGKQYEQVNKIIDTYLSRKYFKGYDALGIFFTELLFNQEDITNNDNILPEIDNFVYHLTKEFSEIELKKIYLELPLTISSDSPKWMQNGKLCNLRRWRKEHEKKSLKSRKIKTKEFKVKKAKRIIKTLLEEVV